jgi:plasmid maintenance system antidote protein VapI
LTTKTTNEEFREYVSQAEAARIIGTTKQTVANLIRRGCFTTQAVAGRILVLRSEAESFVAKSKGRPSKEVRTKKKPLKKSPEVIDRETLRKYIGQAEAARIRGVSQTAIANLIRRGRLTAVRAAGRTLVLRSEVEAFVPQPRTGRPPKKSTRAKTPQRKKSKK